ncbi:MAG: Holliday junction branch migration protein RuvA [Bacillota bacterium]
MIAYLKGNVQVIGADHIILDVNNVGYIVKMSGRGLASIEQESTLKILTYLHIREESYQIFGFINDIELELFKLLLCVNGVGPKGAMAILSHYSAEEVIKTIINEKTEFLSKVSGIGKKTAQRIIVELKDKISKLYKADSIQNFNNELDDVMDEVLNALVSLGYNQKDVQQLVFHAAKEIGQNMTVEKLLSSVLKKLAPSGR